jgi:hypothetical protein
MMNRGAEQPDYSPDGVDLTLIRWFLTLTPAERLTALKEHLSALERMRKLTEMTDFQEVLRILLTQSVDFIVVGGSARCCMALRSTHSI